MSHTATAAKVAEHKKENPALYCRYPGCLWRVVTNLGPNACRKHGTFPRVDEPTDKGGQR